MARPRIVDVDYFQFQQALRKAIDSGQRIDVAEKDRWLSWVRENNIKEAAFKSFAQGKYQGLEPVIIDVSDDASVAAAAALRAESRSFHSRVSSSSSAISIGPVATPTRTPGCRITPAC